MIRDFWRSQSRLALVSRLSALFLPLATPRAIFTMPRSLKYIRKGTMVIPSRLVAFQSRVGPIKWLEPNIEAETRRLAAAGCRRLFVQPVSFTCEHIETLLELDLELKETAEKAGLHGFARGAALNEDAVWLDSLAGHLAATAFGRGNHSA